MFVMSDCTTRAWPSIDVASPANITDDDITSSESQNVRSEKPRSGESWMRMAGKKEKTDGPAELIQSLRGEGMPAVDEAIVAFFSQQKHVKRLPALKGDHLKG